MNSNSETPIDVWVNPLRFLSLEGPPLRSESTEVDPLKLLNDLHGPTEDKSLTDILDRYQRLTNYDGSLFLVPANDRILEKLIWPLRSAKQAFCLGIYLGCIALCGTVAEMITIFLFELSGLTLNGVRMGDAAQEKLFGRSFEKLPQERRLEILEVYGILKKEAVNKANQIRGMRRAYLHILSKEFTSLETDAEQAYKSAALLIKEVVGLKPTEGGSVAISSRLVDYLSESIEGEDR